MAPPESSASTSQSSAPATTHGQESSPSPPLYYGTPPTQHNIALAAAVIGPIGLLLPGGKGRKMFSLQNMVLFSGTFFGLNQLAHDYSGKSIFRRSNDRWAAVLQPLDTLPEKAKASKALMEAERARRAAALPAGEREVREEEIRRRGEAQDAAQRSFFDRVWMGNEKAGWQDRRREEDQKALDSGKGIADIIMDQIWEVWNQGGKEKKGDGKGDASKADAVKADESKGSAESGKKP